MDRIDNFPDHIFQHIISFLPTKDAVGTSILARKWRDWWTSIPNLDFDDKLIYSRRNAKDPKMKARFMNFVDRVMMHHGVSNIQKFNLKCDDSCELSRINTWIGVALRREVRELNLYIDLKSPSTFEMPRCLFTCESLVILKLKIRPNFIKIPTSICFSSLKIFHLDSVIFPNDHLTEQLFSSCPVLEELVMERCEWQNMKSINICSPTLRRLTIIQTKGVFDLESEHMVEINTPNLVFLKVIGFLAEEYYLCDLPLLVDAFIDVENSYDVSEPWEISHEEYGNCVRRLISVVSDIKFLTISGDTIETLFSADINSLKHLPTFYNLKHLELTTYLDQYSIAIWHLLDLLECSPNLELLVLPEGLKYDNEDWQSLRICRCLLPHLRAFEIRSFHWNTLELELIGFFLKNARVLETMTIVSSECLSHDEKKQKKKAINFSWNELFDGLDSQSPIVLHLKTIKLWQFDGYGEELKLVEYLLKDAKFLKKIAIFGLEDCWMI